MPIGPVFLVGVLLGLAALAPAVAIRRHYQRKMRALEQQLEQAAARPAQTPPPPADPFPALERLAGNIAQQFDDLLTTITGYSELVLDALGPRSPLRHDVEEISRAGERATAIVGELLAFSGRQPLLPVPIDLNTMIRQMHPRLQEIAGPNLAVTTTLDLNLCPVEADWHWLERILIALVERARSTMPDGGSVALETANTAEGESSYVMLSVRDTGPELDENARQRLFDPEFERGGLGLAMVRGVVRKSGGFVRVETSKGTAIQILLPRCTEAEVAHSNRGLYVVRGAGR